MAFGEKCYCCGKVYPRDDLFYCEECLMKLSKAFETGEGVVFNPKHYDHCISCGEYKNRKMSIQVIRDCFLHTLKIQSLYVTTVYKKN